MKNLLTLQDEQLVSLYAKGYDEAFDVLLDRHKDNLFAYIAYVVQDQDTANDVFQETFVRAITTIRQGKYNETGRFFSWLTCIAHNLAIDVYRTSKSNTVISADDEERNVLNNIDIVESYTEADLVNAQTLKDVRRLMEALPRAQRDVVFMRFYQDMSFKEIAETTGDSINTCLGRMRYAVINMRRLANEHGISLSMIE